VTRCLPQTESFMDERPQPAARPLVDTPTCYSSPEGMPDMVGTAHKICPLGHLVRQTK
jgi:hypothetical protein